MSQVFNYCGYEIELRETGEANVALFQTNPLERRVMVTSTVSEGIDVLRERV